jgi:hypothetical protein
MSFWQENNFFMNFKNHIVKWYQTVLLPVFHIDNTGKRQLFKAADDDEYTADYHEALASNKGENKDGEASGKTITMPAQKKKGPAVTGDAAAVLDRINNDRESEMEKIRREAEEARKKSEEEARLAAIMNANKVDVNSFIEQGKSAAQEADELRRAQEIMDRLNREAAEDEAKKQAEIEEAKRQAAGNAAGSGNAADDEAVRRAQEIMDRLNREAAEDEAKKQAEIDAAKALASEKFGQ